MNINAVIFQIFKIVLGVEVAGRLYRLENEQRVLYWVDFRQIREIVGSQSHHMDKWGQYFAAGAVTGEEDRSELTTKPKY